MKIKFNLSTASDGYGQVSNISKYDKLPQKANHLATTTGVYYTICNSYSIVYYIDTDVYKFKQCILSNSAKKAMDMLRYILREQALDKLI